MVADWEMKERHEMMVDEKERLADLLAVAIDLLSEYVTGEPHVHCDEDSGGNHSLDGEWWEKDALEIIEQGRRALGL